MAEMRNFALRDAEGNEIGVFTGKSPRQAALKAANRGYTDIKLRERGTKKVHVFTGERVQVDKPGTGLMPDKICQGKKVGIDKLDEVKIDSVGLKGSSRRPASSSGLFKIFSRLIGGPHHIPRKNCPAFAFLASFRKSLKRVSDYEPFDANKIMHWKTENGSSLYRLGRHCE
jgi:hypothetical protein